MFSVYMDSCLHQSIRGNVYLLSIYCIYNSNILYRFNQGGLGEYLINIVLIPAYVNSEGEFRSHLSDRLGNRLSVHPS